MESIEKRLDKVKRLIQEPEFLEGKGLSNEVNIRIFCYEAKDEMMIRHFIDQVAADVSLNCHPIIYNLYDVFLDICREMDILDDMPDMEAEDGGDYLLEQIHSAIGESDFIEKMKYQDAKKGDVLILTGIGEVFPFMRVHSLLEAMQPHFSAPILVMYPGEFDGHQVKLFNKLKPNDYYRAFSVI